MAKVSGLGLSGVTVQDASASAKDITNDVLSINITTSAGTFDVTGLDKSAFERLIGMEDAKLDYELAWNPASSHAHAVFSGSKAVARQCVIPLPAGGGSGATATVTCLITSYAPTRDASGKMTAKASLELSNGTALAWS